MTKIRGFLSPKHNGAQWEVIPWVQSYGALAELVAPASWRESLRANADAMSTKYTPKA